MCQVLLTISYFTKKLVNTSSIHELFVSSDEKFDDTSVAQSLCGIARDFFAEPLQDVAPYPMPYLLYLILKIQKHFLLALSELRLLYLPHLHWYREFP